MADLGDVASVAGVPVAVAVGWVAWRGWRTAEQVRRDQAGAEARRRWRETRPVLEVSADLRYGSDTGLLVVKLIGPGDVERYDRIRVSVRDDRDREFPGEHRGYSQDEWRRQVWGPFRLRPGVDGADQDGRSAVQDGRAVTDEWTFTIERTTPPSWYSGGGGGWRRDYEGAPVRLRIEVGLGDESWVDVREVPHPPAVDGSLMA